MRSQSPEPALRVIRQLLEGVDPAFVVRLRTAWNIQFPSRRGIAVTYATATPLTY
jgi:hypothetical protein